MTDWISDLTGGKLNETEFKKQFEGDFNSVHNNPVCPYCGNRSALVQGDTVYPHRPDLHNKNFYYCNYQHDPAYVGCHPGTKEPLGRLADANLRKLKSRTHQVFDPLWRQNHFDTRKHAYRWLAERLSIEEKDCHIGMFDEMTCTLAIGACYAKLKEFSNS
tara:strand:+ start:1145 stop:1627 length:483 start_codon:yes stop_codon:yes gene_type:complete